IASAVLHKPIAHTIAMTGELSIHGKIKPIGGVVAKVEAAMQAGAQKVIIPKDNWLQLFTAFDTIEIAPVETLNEVFTQAFGEQILLPDAATGPVIEQLSRPAVAVMHA